MKLALLTAGCAAALTLVGAAGAQAEMIYTTEPGYVATDPAYVVTEPNVVATTPGSVVAVPAPPFGPFTPRYIVTQPTVVVAPQAAPQERVIERERVVVEPRQRTTTRRDRVVVRERERLAAPREQVIERERIVASPENRTVISPQSVVTTTGSSSGCFIDLNGFERCY